MSVETRYIDDVLREVLAAPGELDRLEADLRNHFREGRERGESDSAVAARLGEPRQVAASFMDEVELEPAGFWARLFAFTADAGLLMAISMPFFALFAFTPRLVGPDQQAVGGFFVVGAILIGIALAGVGILYFPLFEGHFGWTPGKRLMRLRVIGEDRLGIGYGQAFLRRLSFYFELLVLDSLFIPFTAKRQRAFDIVAKTLVVREPDSRRPAWRWLACLLPLLVPAVVAALLALANAGAG